MQFATPGRGKPARIVAGVEVEVRSVAEILSTLDAHGKIDGLPFMPEMLRFAGRRLQVASRADTTCWNNDLRAMNETVHLSDARCDGSAHGGCQAGCLLFWKEEWLRPVGVVADPPTRPAGDDDAVGVEDLARSAEPRREAAGDYYSCQATELRTASRPLNWWNPTHFFRDIRTGNVRAGRVLRYLAPHVFNKMQTWSRSHLPAKLQIRGGTWFPFVGGPRRAATPQQRLDLAPGERVRVKDRASISATLTPTGHNRGLSFDVEMLDYCGQYAPVRSRVERNIDEDTGRMLQIKSDCLILEGVTCKAKYHGFCSRETFPYWREIWLQRSESGGAGSAGQGGDAARVPS